MKPWWKLIRPKQDIIDGESIDLGVFAIHLDQIASNNPEAPEIYRNPRLFFPNTVFTNGMIRIIRHVQNRLSGNVDSGSVINLNTAFGGGKTHTLVALFHMFKNGDKVKEWLPKGTIDKDIIHLQEMSIPKARIVTWVGTNYSIHTPDGNGMRTPWGQILGQVSDEAIEIIRPFDEGKSRPDTDTIRKIISDGEPTLFLLDEILNAMEGMRAVSIGDTTLNHQFKQFYMNLSNVVASSRMVSIVNSFSKSIGNISEKDEEDLDLLLNIGGRVDESLETATGNEISWIIRRRLLEDVEDEKDKKEIAKAVLKWSQWAIQNKDDLVIDMQYGELGKAFRSSYPFHPRVLQVFEKKWQGLNSFGRTRGVLRMLSLWLRNAFLESYKRKQQDEFITLGSAPMDDEGFANIVYQQMGDLKLSIPISSDVAGENAWATVLDQDAQPTIRKQRLHKQVGTAVFFESTGGQKQEFASTGEVRWSLCGPNSVEFSDIDTCLNNLESKGHYFRTKNKLHRISPRANLNKLKNTERSSINEEDIDKLIETIVKEEIGKGKSIEVIPFTRYSEDVHDHCAFQFCVLPPDVLPGEGENQAIGVMKRIIDSSKRTYKRHLGFLTTTTGRAKLVAISRDHLTYEAIIRNINNYQLEDADKEELPLRSKQALDDLRDEVWNSYRKLYLGGSDGIPEVKDVLGLMNKSMSKYGIAGVVEERLKQHDIITPTISHRVTEHWPPVFENKPWPLLSLRDNVFQSDKAVKARIINATGLKKSIMSWVKNKHVVLVSLDENGDYNDVIADSATSDMELPTLVTFDNSTGILFPKQILKPVKPEPTPKPQEEEREPEPEEGVIIGGPTTIQVTPSETPTPEATEIDLKFSAPIKKMNSIVMEMSMGFESTSVSVHFKGKPKKGLSQEPLAKLKKTIVDSGGSVE